MRPGRAVVTVRTRRARVLVAPSEEQVGGHRPLPLYLDPAARSELVALPQLFVGPRRDLDGAGQAVGLHAAGGIDGVAPEVVDELRPADDAGDDRAGVDADPHLERQSRLRRTARDLGPHRKRQLGDRLGVIIPWLGYAARSPVGVFDPHGLI